MILPHAIAKYYTWLFLTNYIDQFTNERYEWYRVIENIQDIWSKFDNFTDFHVLLLDKFYKYIVKQKPSNAKQDIINICLVKFVENKKYVTEQIANVRQNNDVDTLLTTKYTK